MVGWNLMSLSDLFSTLLYSTLLPRLCYRLLLNLSRHVSNVIREELFDCYPSQCILILINIYMWPLVQNIIFPYAVSIYHCHNLHSAHLFAKSSSSLVSCSLRSLAPLRSASTLASLAHSVHRPAHSPRSVPRGTLEILEYVFTLRTRFTGRNAF